MEENYIHIHLSNPDLLTYLFTDCIGFTRPYNLGYW